MSAVTDAGAQVQVDRARFPALDPEPPPRPWYQRAARFALVVTLLGLVVAGVVLAVHALGHKGPGAGVPATARSAAGGLGQIVLLGPNSELELSSVEGSDLTPLGALGRYPNQVLAATADGRYLVASGGTVISVHGARLSIQHTHAAVTAQQTTTWPDPLANGDQDLIVVPQSGRGPVWAVPLATGKPVALGLADTAEGDPQQAGAFVSVATGAPPPQLGNGFFQSPLPPDGRVELRDAGQPPVVLATAASLNRALGQKPARQVSLGPYPSPDGNRVAIAVTDATGIDDTEGIVVVDRSGHPEYALPESAGPGAGDGLAWSPDGRSLAFVAPGTTSSAVVVWTPGRPPYARPDPTPGDMPLYCIWDPHPTAVLCATELGDRALDWNLAGVQSGPVAAITAIGQPIAWLSNRAP